MAASLPYPSIFAILPLKPAQKSSLNIRLRFFLTASSRRFHKGDPSRLCSVGGARRRRRKIRSGVTNPLFKANLSFVVIGPSSSQAAFCIEKLFPTTSALPIDLFASWDFPIQEAEHNGCIALLLEEALAVSWLR
jgi:hypothetical protein